METSLSTLWNMLNDVKFIGYEKLAFSCISEIICKMR